MKFLFVRCLVILFFLLCRTLLFSQGSCASPDGSFFGYNGVNQTYASADASGWCYNNLTPGQTYCWTYFYPSSGSFKMQVIKNQSCGSCDGSVTLNLPSSCSGGCSSVGTVGCGMIQYNSTCAVQEANNFEHGGSGSCTPAEVCGTIFTMCITVPGGCATMDVCPMVYCTAGPSNCIGLMPISLLNLNGKYENGSVNIAWTSASESNNDYFTIERAVSFFSEEQKELNFIPIGFVKGAGNSSSPLSYQFTDGTFITAKHNADERGFLYYRLKQTDFDGKYVYYGPISVKLENENNAAVFPSISTGIFHLLHGKETSRIIIYDVFGNIVLEDNTAENELSRSIDLSDRSNGIYFVKIISGNSVETQKILLHK